LAVTGNIDGNRIQSGLSLSRTGIYAGAFTLGVDNANNSFFIANTLGAAQGTSRFVIDSQGNVALNLDTPTVGLDVAGAARFRTGGIGPTVSAGNNQALTLLGNSYLDTVNLQYASYTNANVWAMSYRQQTENGDFWIYQNESGANIKHITLKYNTPSVGINQVNPTATLHVGSNAAGTLANVKVESANGTQAQITAYPAYAALGTLNNFPVALQVNGSNVMVVSTGNSVTMSGGLSAASFSSDTLIANTIIANVSMSSPGNITGGNLIANTGITGTLTTAAQPNITSVGTLTSLTVTGNITGGNLNTSGAVTGNLTGNVTGNVTGAASLNVLKTGDTMTGDIAWATTGRGITWGMNTDGASIRFYNVGDGDTNSRLEFNTSDNNNEYFSWTHTSGASTYESMRLTPNGSGSAALRIYGNVTVDGTASGTFSGTGTGLTLSATNLITGTLDQARLANASLTVNGTSIALGGSGTITATATNALTIGTGLGGTSYNGSTGVTITNTGVTSVVAGTNIAVSGATGAVTISVTGTVPTAANAANLTTTNFSVRENSGKLYFYYGVTAIASLDNTGHWTTLGNITGFGTP
jgi:hypothetical protein